MAFLRLALIHRVKALAVPKRWRVRVLAFTALAVPVIGAAGGCATSDPLARMAQTSIARSRARALAQLLTVRQADLPEFKVTARPAMAQEGMQDAHEAKCARPPAGRGSSSTAPSARHARAAEHARQPVHRGTSSRPGHRSLPSQRRWAFAKSERLSAGSGYHTLGATSTASIMPTPVAAQLVVAKLRSRDRTCMEHALRGRLVQRHVPVSVRGVVVEPLSLNVPGADASVAYQTVIGTRGPPLVLYTDSVYFSYGQDLMLLETFHASKPVPPTMDQRLVGLLVARARSHSR